MTTSTSLSPAIEITDNQLYFPSDKKQAEENPFVLVFERLADKVSESTLLEKSTFFDKNLSLSQNIASLKKIYQVSKQKATSLIQRERDILISQPSVNGLLGRYVVKNVSAIEDMSVVLNQDTFILLLSMKAKGITARVSASFELLNFTFNDHTQKMVYKQLSHTHIEEMYYDSLMTQLKVKIGLWYLKHIKKRDLLGFIFEYMEMASVKTAKEINHNTQNKENSFDSDTILGDEITIHLERFFKSKNMIKQLSRFQISDACIKQGKLSISSKVNLDGFLNDETE